MKKALELVMVLYKGRNIKAQAVVKGHKPRIQKTNVICMICDCDPGGDYCTG